MPGPGFRGCPRCGGVLVAADLYGAKGLACQNCDAVVLMKAELGRIAAGAVDATEETAESAPLGSPAPAMGRTPAPRRSRPAQGGGSGLILALTVLAASVAILLGIPAAWLAVSVLSSGRVATPISPFEAAPPALSAPIPVAATPLPTALEPVLTVPVPAVPDPVEPPVKVDPLADTDAPEPPPAAPAPAPAPVVDPVARGWKLVDRGSIDDAARSFRQGISAHPLSPDAHYGLGYCLLKQGSTDEAQRELCTALRDDPGTDQRREIQGLLTQHKWSCP
jgi:hypothetical protein